jgi:hypothetical protein
MPSTSTILLFLYTALPVFAAAQTCYALDAAKLDSTITPCAPVAGAKHSGCCASTDICLDNGLCMATTNAYIGTMWQAGCTDPTGKDKACPQMCPTGMFPVIIIIIITMTNPLPAVTKFNGTDPVPAWNIQSCDLGTYCCRAPNDPESCCSSLTAPRFNTTSIGAFPARLLSDASPTPSPSPSSSPIPSATLSPTPAPSALSQDKHTTAVVGGVLGSILGVVLLGATAIIMWLHSKEQHQRRLKEHYEDQFAQTGAYRRALAASSASLRRVNTEDVVTEDIHTKDAA